MVSESQHSEEKNSTKKFINAKNVDIKEYNKAHKELRCHSHIMQTKQKDVLPDILYRKF